MDEDYKIIDSKLNQTFTSKGHSVEVMIYRAESEEGWILEVEDEWGNSTCWDEEFDTDEQALATFIKEIEKDGIQSVIHPPT